MKILWIATALLLIASTALAQEQTCDAKIRTAHAMMEELQEQIRVMSARAARHYGQLSVEVFNVNAELVTVRFELERLRNDSD